MFIHLSTRLRFQYSLRAYTSLLMCCVCCRINQLNYLWWWINRFVFRWRAQLAALSTTNCRRIEWWNLERERVLGQSQCYSWFRGFFLTQLRVRDTVAIRFHQQWWMNRIASLVTKEFRYQVLHGDTHRSRVVLCVTNRTESFAWRVLCACMRAQHNPCSTTNLRCMFLYVYCVVDAIYVDKAILIRANRCTIYIEKPWTQKWLPAELKHIS